MSAPSVCKCRWCGEKYEPAGITNHETYCSESPHPGVPVEQQQDLGIYEDPNDPTDETGDGSPAVESHPDQRATSTDGGALPPREEVGDTDSFTDPDPVSSPDPDPDRTCPKCGSDDTMPTHQAREEFRSRMDSVPPGLIATMDATDLYCNQCWSVWGGELDEPHRIVEVAQ